MTSHDAVSAVRRTLGTRSVGHAGTLDPAAAGVLPMAVGKATRLLEYVINCHKAYIGEATFGVQTDTLDQEGQIERQMAVALDERQLITAMEHLRGPSMQVPPAYSAVKLSGKPLYQYARAGETPTVPPRAIQVDKFQLLEFTPGNNPRCLFFVECSKGTYIRVLVQDLAESLGAMATLTWLLRAKVGDFDVQQAWTLEELQQLKTDGRITDCLLPLDSAIKHLPFVQLPAPLAKKFLLGQPIPLDAADEGALRVYHRRLLLGIGQCTGQRLSPHKVLVSQEELLDDCNQ
jgi:tRNA pseudouridine55 synthase